MNPAQILETMNAGLQQAIAAREARLTLIWARCVLVAAEKLDRAVTERDGE